MPGELGLLSLWADGTARAKPAYLAPAPINPLPRIVANEASASAVLRVAIATTAEHHERPLLRVKGHRWKETMGNTRRGAASFT